MAEIRANFNLSQWNANQLRLRVPVIIRAYGDVLDPQLKEEIKTVQFLWPGTTRRRNGATVGSPRDIVDTGAFLRSQRRDYPDATTLRLTWDVKSPRGFSYAGLILTGYATRTGRIMPPRDWITPALTKLPLDRFFAAEWQRQAGGNR